VPSEAGQTAIAVLVDEGLKVVVGLIVVVDFCVGVDDTTGWELLLLNGAQADSNSASAKNGSKRRGICIGNS
jgi:hypothetical protein